MQQARTAARSIRRLLAGKEALPFEYFDKGSLATIGRSRAIAMVDRMHLHGFLAWLAWLFVHIFYLIGFKNRVVVMITWAWSYVTYKRGARLVVGYAGTKHLLEALCVPDRALSEGCPPTDRPEGAAKPSNGGRPARV